MTGNVFSGLRDTTAMDAVRTSYMSSGTHKYGRNLRTKSRRSKVPPRVYTIRLTLEQLDRGCVVQKDYQQTCTLGLRGQVTRNLVAAVRVKPGSLNGDKVVHKGVGNEFPGMEPGDLVFVIEQTKHPLFTRANATLRATKSIDQADMISGCEFQVDSIRGERITVTREPPIADGDTIVVKGEGMCKKFAENGERGDLIITLKVVRRTSVWTKADKERMIEKLKHAL